MSTSGNLLPQVGVTHQITTSKSGRPLLRYVRVQKRPNMNFGISLFVLQPSGYELIIQTNGGIEYVMERLLREKFHPSKELYSIVFYKTRATYSKKTIDDNDSSTNSQPGQVTKRRKLDGGGGGRATAGVGSALVTLKFQKDDQCIVFAVNLTSEKSGKESADSKLSYRDLVPKILPKGERGLFMLGFCSTIHNQQTCLFHPTTEWGGKSDGLLKLLDPEDGNFQLPDAEEDHQGTIVASCTGVIALSICYDAYIN